MNRKPRARTLGTLLCTVATIFALASCAAIPKNTTVLRDLSYGKATNQDIDVYTPAGVHNAPVIFMVHGGAWIFGDKGAPSVVTNKMTRWVNKGMVFISVNYRLVPAVGPLVQAEDVGAALAYAQKHAPEWGGDPTKFVIMGHSAGAHLVSLLAADPAIAYRHGAKLWLGTVAIDSGGYDIGEIRRNDHYPWFYAKAFGDDPKYWRRVSPIFRLTEKQGPFLAICSELRKDKPCIQARAFTDKATSLGMRAQLLPEQLSHREVNVDLGEDNTYTRNVEAFLATLDPALRDLLLRNSKSGNTLGVR